MSHHASSPFCDEFKQLSPNVHRMILPYQLSKILPMIPVSIFLVHDDSQYYLIDAGPPKMEKEIIGALAKFFGKEQGDESNASILKELSSIMLTHYHVDHCGSLRALYDLSGQSIHVSCHPDEIDFVGEEKPNFKNVKSDNWQFSMFKRFIEQPTLGVPTKPHTDLMNSYRKNESGDEKKQCNMKFCHCPGHTPGHCCFYHEEDRVLIGSDLIMNTKKGNKLEYSPSVSSPNIKESIENTKQLFKDISDRVDRFFPSHDISEEGVTIDEVVKFVDKN